MQHSTSMVENHPNSANIFSNKSAVQALNHKYVLNTNTKLITLHKTIKYKTLSQTWHSPHILKPYDLYQLISTAEPSVIRSVERNLAGTYFFIAVQGWTQIGLFKTVINQNHKASIVLEDCNTFIISVSVLNKPQLCWRFMKFHISLIWFL